MERKGAKSGGNYGGGFFHLFDWSAKSRKKLFSSKSELPELSKQGKLSHGNLPMTRLRLMDDDEYGAGSSVRNGDYSCVSSVTDDDGYRSKPAGVIAKLMGLDSLPASSFPEPNCTPFFGTQSLKEASHVRKQFAYDHDYHSICSDGPPMKLIESRPQRVISRPIEKFQTEILPPKSAKLIPITHHKLLSPIKSANFIPSNTPAHIMEAAAKIIESSPQPPAKTKMPAVGASSAPLKVRSLKSKLEVTQRMPIHGSRSLQVKGRDQKEKLEPDHTTSRTAHVSRRPTESNAAKCLKGQPLNKSWNGSVDASSSRICHEPEEPSSGQKTKGRSVSLAVQAKVNVQRRVGLNLNGSRGTVPEQKETSEQVTSQPCRSQPTLHKSSTTKSSSPSTSVMLRQNNQKQNCLMEKDKLSTKPSISSLQSRKTNLGNPYGRPKTSEKIAGSRYGLSKSGPDCEKGGTGYTTNNTPRKKQSLDGNLQFDKKQVVANMLINRSQKEAKSDSASNKNLTLAEESARTGTDVVSFTFTAPLSTPSSRTPRTSSHSITQKDERVCAKNCSKRLLIEMETMKPSSVCYNIASRDALSTLLEKKLKELADAVESSSRNTISKVASASRSASLLQDTIVSPDADCDILKFHSHDDQKIPCPDKVPGEYRANSYSPDSASIEFKPLLQVGFDALEECSSSKYEDAEKLLDCRRPSPISVLEHSFSTESSCTLESMDSSSTDGSKQCSWPSQAQEVSGLVFHKKHPHLDVDTELLDSASSTSYRTVSLAYANNRCCDWEVVYVNKMVDYVDLMFHDFAVGWCTDIVNPDLFNRLESRKNEVGNRSAAEAEARLERKALFDCVSERLDIRCRRYVGGGYKAWLKGVAVVSRKDQLAEQLQKEVISWRKMGNCMVDEVVDKDMSSQYGNWLDYEVDAFGVGAEIEGLILNSLVDELVADIRLWR